MNKLRLTYWARSEGGTSATEFALLLPLILLLLLGLTEIGRLFWSYNIAAASVRDAGRYAARLPITCAGLSAGDELSVKRLARTGTIDGSASPLLGGWTSDATVTVAVSCLDNTSGTYAGRFDEVTEIPRIQITARPPYQTLFGGIVPFRITELNAQHAEVWTE